MRLYRLLLHTRLRLVLSDWRFLLAMLVIPLFLSAIAGNALSRQKQLVMTLLVADQDGTSASAELVEGLRGKERLSVKLTALEAAQRQVEDNLAEAWLLIPDGYQERVGQGTLEGFLQLETAASADSRGFLTELIAAEVFRLSGEGETVALLRHAYADLGLTLTPDRAEAAAGLFAEKASHPWLEVRYEVLPAKAPVAGTVNYPAAVASSLGLLVLFVLFGMLFGAGWLVEDRRNGTLARLYAARGASFAWFFGNWTAMALVGLGLTVLLSGGAWLLAGEPPVRGIASWLLLICYISCVSSVGMLLSTLFPSPARLQAATPVIAVVSGFAGGCLWNQMGLVGGLPWVALVTPQGWVLQALGRLYADPGDTTWRSAALVLTAAAAMLALFSWLRLKRMLRRSAV